MRSIVLSAAAALTLVPAAPAAGQELAGTWELSYTRETPRGSLERTLTVHLQQDGSTLTGTAEMAAMGQRGGGGEARTVDISDGKVEDGAFSFGIVVGGGQRSFTLTFSGRAQGDTMEGTLEAPMGGETPFTGKRLEG
jgi:hypothetical protein